MRLGHVAWGRAVGLVPLLVLLSGCYTVVLRPISPVPSRPLPVTATIRVAPESADYLYTVRSAAAGFANRFRIRVGEALVQYADAYLKPAFPAGDQVAIGIRIERFSVRGFEAHIDASFAVRHGAQVLFSHEYQAAGRGYFKQTVWGGAFAMKSSMRKTTDEALRSLFEQFLTDARARAASWAAAAPAAASVPGGPTVKVP